MRKSPRPTLETAYPELFEGDNPLLTARDVKSQQEFLLQKSAYQAKQLKKQTKRYELDDGRKFKMAVLHGKSKNTFVGFSEYATHARRDRLTQLLAIRALCDPDASVVFQAHTAWWSRNMRFLPNERDKLYEGNSDPVVERTEEVLIAEGLKGTRLHLVGASLGATFATDLAASTGRVHSLTTLETTDIIKGTGIDLARDLEASGPHLFENINLGKLDTDVRTLRQGLDTLAAFGINALHPDNLATMGRLRYATHKDSLMRAIDRNPDMGLVRAWTAQSAISPREENLEIDEMVQRRLNGRYASKMESFEFTGELASHNSSNIPILFASLVRRAMQLG